jgi:ribosomal protein S12 methylthiotransferase accessory factor YcaO
MMTRKELRLASANYLNTLSGDELFGRFGITRVGKIDSLDTIGVPVWSACRPGSLTISVTAGKAFSDEMARAGAIAEAIEYHVLEHTMLVEGQTSNGNAIGATEEDALAQAIFELVERDAITKATREWQAGKMPAIIHRYSLPETSACLASMCEKAGAVPLFFYCTKEIKLPVFWCVLVDNSGAGSFAGWGCHLTEEQALNRAILEAIQSRAVYIAGARDDIKRRNFEFIKSMDWSEVTRDYNAAQPQHWVCAVNPDLSAEAELELVKFAIRPRIWSAYANPLGELTAVRVEIDGLEGPIFQ